MNTGALLWVTDGTGLDHDVVEECADTFKLGVRFCRLPEAAGLLRGQRWDMVVVDLDPSGEGLELLRTLGNQTPRPALVATARDGGLAAVRAALDAGADDVIAVPVATHELHKALLRVTRAGGGAGSGGTVPGPRTAAGGEVIAVYGARGGLGTTTVAVNLAHQLATLTSREVCLLDLDLQRGDVAASLNLQPAESIATIAGAGRDIDELFLAGALTRHPSGVFVLAAPAEIEDADAIGHDDVATAIRLLRTQFRYVVVDTPRTITGATLPAFELSDRILLLTDLSVPSIRAARRFRDLLARLNAAPTTLELLVTESRPGPVAVQDAAGALGKQPFLLLPRDEAIATQAMNEGTPIESVASPLRAALTDLAARLAGIRMDARPPRARLFQRLLSSLGGGQSA